MWTMWESLIKHTVAWAASDEAKALNAFVVEVAKA